jgi:hypothetical protein
MQSQKFRKRKDREWIDYFSIQRGRRGPRNEGLSSHPLTPSRMFDVPGKSVSNKAETPFISLAMLFRDSYVNVFTDLS